MIPGPDYLQEGKCKFTVWAPFAERVDLRITRPDERVVPMKKAHSGYWQVLLDDVSPGTCYLFRINDSVERPDPASNFQPESVHEHSQVIDHASFPWGDHTWSGIALQEMVIYELHVGTFAPEGTFEAIIPRLDELLDLGINAIEIMPVAGFPGSRNWGYDGVYPYAVQNSYGRCRDFKKLINACHRRNIAVILDVVYNHLGPEGNYLRDFGPYFTDSYTTPWGDAINFDGAYSDQVREYFINNAIFWFRNYHIDALRLDALHAIYDMSAKPFLRELAEQVRGYSQRHREHYLIAESDLNDVKLIDSPDCGGYGLDAQWCDDFHHALHALLTGEEQGYYADFGNIGDLAKAFEEGFVYSWRYSKFRKRHHGSSSRENPARQFVVFSQNHDQVGNRMRGDRLSELVDFETQKLAAGAVLLSPYVPLLFMGQEYGEKSPFLYFVSHNDPDLIEAVCKGRQAEFEAFQWTEQFPDPQDTKTFTRSILNWSKKNEEPHKTMLRLHKELIRLRKTTPALANLSKKSTRVHSDTEASVLVVRRGHQKGDAVEIFNFGDEPRKIEFPGFTGIAEKIIDSAEAKWKGPGSQLPQRIDQPGAFEISPRSFALYQVRRHS